jgi:hypothetical protein
MQVYTCNWPEMQPVVNEFAVCGLRFAVCGLRFAVCGLRFAVGGWRLAVGGLPLTVGGWSHRGDRAGQPNGWD